MDAAPCTKDLPCTRIDKALTEKQIVKVAGTVEDSLILNSQVGIILAAPDTTLRPPPGGNSPALDVQGTSDLRIYDLRISNGNDIGISLSGTAKIALTRVTVSNNANHGIALNGGSLICTQCILELNGGRGLDTRAGSVTLTQSLIRHNLGGGILISGPTQFDITGNFVSNNGLATNAGARGITIAVDVQMTGAPPNKLDFNSVSGSATVDAAKGIECISGTPLIANSNIIWSNGSNPSSDTQVSVTQCTFTYSDIGPQGLSGINNVSIDPGFMDLATDDLHLTSGSPVLGKADPTISLGGLAARDIDGQARVARAGMGADIGADQYYPSSAP
jgi:hypothetical protein